MAKLPKFSDFTDVSGLMNKVKSAFDNLTGPAGSAACEDALSKESNPTKAKLLEIELLINQIHELLVLQNKAINDLASKYTDVKKLAIAALVDQPGATADASSTSTNTEVPEAKSEVKDDSKEKGTIDPQ